MHVIQALLLGIVEGISEFLPISSTAHLILVSHLLKIPTTDFVKSFEISVQLGAILAVVVLFWRRFWEWETLKLLLVGLAPTLVIGFFVYPLVRSVLLANASISVFALMLGGVGIIAFELWYQKRAGANRLSVSLMDAFVMGLSQSVAIVPGISRSAATIIGGLSRGLERKTVTEFSFLLAVPTLAAATGLDIIKHVHSFTMSDVGILAVGFFAAFFAGVLAIRFLLGYISRHSFIPFGVYRIALAIIMLTLLRSFL